MPRVTVTAALAATLTGSFGLSVLLTGGVRRVARRQQRWSAAPRVDRWHHEPTPLLGGVAIYGAFSLGLLAALPLSGWLVGLLLLTTLVFSVGLLDDLRDLRPQTKVLAQLVSGLLLYSFGFHFNQDYFWILDLAIVVFWVLVVTNAMNLLDNMNGLAAGIAVIAGFYRLLFYVQASNVEGAMVSAAFVGAVAGFLLFNFPRASIFMGDAGSLTLGFVLAALNLTNGQAYTKNLFAVLFFPVLVLAIPIFDTSFVSVVRYFSGRAITQGGRDHVSHRLVAVGLSETRAVLVLWAISAAGGLAAFFFYQVGFSYAWFGATLLMLGLVLFGVVLARVHVHVEADLPADLDVRVHHGFLLPSELRYKRQILWMLLDAATVFLALYGVYLARYGGEAGWDAAAVRFVRVAPPAVTTVLVATWLMGLYRVESLTWSWRDARSIAAGVALAVAGLLGASAWGPPGYRESPAVFLLAWGTIVAAQLVTRTFVWAISRVLKVPLPVDARQPPSPSRATSPAPLPSDVSAARPTRAGVS
jgi:UDP-GlcNAc:undecaprenyl-phosphate GlcNAc-1-phosphate transferase